MYERRITGFNQEVTVIHPGEYLATADDIIISTVLGSCVAVALRDEKAGVAGLNHFMLPGTYDEGAARVARDAFATDAAKYGMYAMELLINDMLKMGCRRERLTAKVFGGASVLSSSNEGRGALPKSNVDFAIRFLETEGIPVLARDVGGSEARKILFFARDGKVLLKRITGTLIVAVKQEERVYRDRIVKKEESGGEVTLFDR